MSIRIAVLCGALAILTAPNDAQAAVWTSGSVGKLDNSQIAFNRNFLVIVPATAPRGKLSDIIHRDALLKDGEPGDSYLAVSGNAGFEPKIEFRKEAGDQLALALTEKSSRVIKVKNALARKGEPARDVRMECMECMEYMLSTKGGRG